MAIFYRRLPKFEFVRPRSLKDVLSLLGEHGREAKLLAGGTDLIPGLKRREIPAPRYVIDLKRIPKLTALSFKVNAGLTIGPLVTISAMENSSVVRRHFPALAQAAATMASPQVRNRGTFAGNICNAVPSADSAPALLALDAKALLKSRDGERTLPLDAFFTGPRQTAMRSDEMLAAIIVPAMTKGSSSVYLKVSPRSSMDLAVVGVAAVGLKENGTCADIKIALGAVAPTPVRAKRAEEILRGKAVSASLIEEAARNAATECRPIDDHRASAEYRCDMVYALTRRALKQVLLGEGDAS
jgi:CO/xanthine dehydrogenase FAD-binding subunit